MPVINPHLPQNPQAPNLRVLAHITKEKMFR